LRRHGRGPDGRAVVLDTLTGPAGVLGPDVPHNLHLGGDEIELFADLLADAGQFAAAVTNFVLFGDVVNDLHTGIFRRDGPTTFFLSGMCRNSYVLRLIGVSREHFGLVEKPILGLILAGKRLALRLGLEDDSLEQADLLFQLGDVPVFVSNHCLMLGNHCLMLGRHVSEKGLENGGIIWQGCDVHDFAIVPITIRYVNDFLSCER